MVPYNFHSLVARACDVKCRGVFLKHFKMFCGEGVMELGIGWSYSVRNVWGWSFSCLCSFGCLLAGFAVVLILLTRAVAGMFKYSSDRLSRCCCFSCNVICFFT